jgi:uncharacterized protein YegJ (DUF2314 family)
MAKRALGVVSLFMGVTILGWVGYNVLWPTREFQRSYRSVLQLTLPILMVTYGWKWLRDDGPGIESLPIDFEAPALRASVDHARRTLPTFLRAVGRHQDGAYIKFPLRTDAGATEHIWAYVHHYADGMFNVSLANTPYTQTGPLESRRDVPEADVEDWQIMTPEGRIRGAYSLRAAFEQAQSSGVRFNRTMRQQQAQLLPLTDSAH